MNQNETEGFMVAMCTRWPNKFADAELRDWFLRLQAYPLRVVMAALDAHKNESKFKPAFSEILARLRGKEQGQQSQESRWPTVPQIIRRQVGEDRCRGMCDAEVIIRYWWHTWGAMKRGRFSGSDGQKSQCLAGCQWDLVGIGWEQERAKVAAQCVLAEPSMLSISLADVLGHLQETAA